MHNKVTQTPKVIPITNDQFSEQDYRVVEAKVDQVAQRQVGELEETWGKLAKDKVVDRREGRCFMRKLKSHKWALDGKTKINTTEAKFIRSRLEANDGVALDPAFRAELESQLVAREQAMLAGKVFNGTFQTGDSLHTLTEGIIDVPYTDFIARMPPDLWGANLADYRGGEIKVTDRDEQGRVIAQRERMISETPYSKVLYQWFGKDRANNEWLPNDMTKVETIHYDDEAGSVAIKWEVLFSDNATTLKDVGELRFSRMKVQLPNGETKEVTKVEMESEHRIDAFPGTLTYLEAIPGINSGIQTMTERVMRDYFTACVERYQQVGLGQAESRLAPNAE